MDFLIIAILILAIVMFFSPLIIIFQLSDIKHLLHKIHHDINKNQDELIFTNNRIARNQSEDQNKNSERMDEILKSLFQDEKNTPD